MARSIFKNTGRFSLAPFVICFLSLNSCGSGVSGKFALVSFQNDSTGSLGDIVAGGTDFGCTFSCVGSDVYRGTGASPGKKTGYMNVPQGTVDVSFIANFSVDTMGPFRLKLNIQDCKQTVHVTSGTVVESRCD